MDKHHRWFAFSLAILAATLIGCSQQVAPAAPAGGAGQPSAAKTGSDAAPAAPAAKAPEIKLKVPESITAQQLQPAPAPTTAAAVPAKPEPKGKFVYGYHVAVVPAYFDPSEVPAVITPWPFIYVMHDALLKHMPGKTFAPSLAETYEIAPDQKSATFKLRPNLKFHNGDPVTAEDVKWTYESYRGGNSKLLKERLDKIETPDARTIKFSFKEAFPDFLLLYGSPASGAGWVLPKKYYEQVGPDGFKKAPIGAGPYKFVRFAAGSELEVEAFTDYWRKVPSVKTIVFKEIPDDATRLAALQTGEVDAINLVPGSLIEKVKQDPKLRLAPTLAAPFFLEFVGWDKPGTPFNDIRVREAASLALDRKALSDAETAGYSPVNTSWIPEDWPGALKGPEPKYDPARAKQLLAEAGYPNGIDVEMLTPVPPYFSFGERVITQLREVGIRTKLNQMERAAFLQKITEGPDAFKGIILNASGAPGDAAARIRAYAVCKGSSSRTCLTEVDEKFARYEKSADPAERTKILDELQQWLLDQHAFPVVYRLGFVNAVGPRVANKWEDIFGAIPQYVYIGPFEDIELKQ